ncbi:unnamed protein product [Penicillium nalgiovense]|uniref:Protein disulfide-isomerase n=1 Tax=Penicillium nalgiovense TaxID=60175 RepID=A0A1V6YJR0_PENNA|nr:hypothetical protein PENNAL_c0019G06782 [Penicillium nalgiovense]CAG8040509.1 unnamed protein product [Penicillium nalgiovense]CAG8040802.1 unnamed protein product [Penicillium nalgiovense]CAG8059295.1 unnamed protein product [Penicillium nalgiovense]CAG8070347.1 unnamed protein product [Penicillium nalgiovense]
MRPSLYILSLLGATATAFTANIRTKSSDVVSLTQETFYDFMEEHDLVLANFYAPWCRHSRNLAPKFEQAATELKSDNIPLIKVDCTQEERLCSDFAIGAYPTLKVFRGPKSHEAYHGSRRAESIISYMIDESIYTGAGGGLYLQTYD